MTTKANKTAMNCTTVCLSDSPVVWQLREKEEQKRHLEEEKVRKREEHEKKKEERAQSKLLKEKERGGT